MGCKIFISHASDDENIGEVFINTLIQLGIDIDEVFFSSKYHTGVKLGQDFNLRVKTAMQEAELVVFLLTSSFYRSEYCLNEMGAVWIRDQRCIPVLLGGLTHGDMKGFIDSRHIAVKPDSRNSHKIYNELKQFSKRGDLDADTVKEIFIKFNREANKMAKATEKELSPLSDTEKDLINNRFTVNEMLLLSYFLEAQSRVIKDGTYCDDMGGEQRDDGLALLEAYSKKYEFDHEKALNSLIEDEIMAKTNVRNANGIHTTYKLNQRVYRDLVALTGLGKSKLESIRIEYAASAS